MANTTNYNWETPDDTDLVKDGAAAIRTLGSSVDTTTKNLNPQTTTGALAYRSATANVNTALPIGTAGQILAVSGGVPAWINNDQGDITEVQAGVGISVASGTGPIPIITNSSTDLITTAGDLLYGTAADTVARLGIGTVGQVLAVNSGATAPEWVTASSGGMTLINTGGTACNTSGVTTTISSIPGTYRNLYIVVDNWYPATDGANMQMYLNGSVTTYTGFYTRVASTEALNSGYETTPYLNAYGVDNTAKNNIFVVTVYEYADTSVKKMFWNEASYEEAGGAKALNFGLHTLQSTTAVTSIDFTVTGGGNSGGGTIFVYGVK